MWDFKKIKDILVRLALICISIPYMLMPIALYVFDSTEAVEFLVWLDLFIVNVFMWLEILIEILSGRQRLKPFKSMEESGK